MVRMGYFRNWLFRPPVTGHSAIFLAFAAVAIPTLVRLGVTGGMDGYQCTIFCPFIVASAILMGWRYAVIVAVGSALSCNILLMGAPYVFHAEPAELAGMSAFLAFSFLNIAVVHLFRRVATQTLNRAGQDEGSGGVIFSLEAGQVWASWNGQGPPVCLGSTKRVGLMMKDFLAQEELGRRLTGQG